MSIIAWVILGLISGFIASKIVNKTGEGVVLDIVLGIVGAIIGGFLFAQFGATGVSGLNLYSMFVSVIGAIVVLLIYHAVVRRRLVWSAALSSRRTTVDENRFEGVMKTVADKIEDAVGGRAGDTRTKFEGKLDQGAGVVQTAVGRAVDEFGGAVMAVRASSFVKQATSARKNTASIVRDAAKKSGAQALDMGELLYVEGRRAGQSVGRAVEGRPLTAVLVAAALGYWVAYLVHRY